MAARKVKEKQVAYGNDRKAPFDIKERTFLFGVRVVKLVGRLPRNVAGVEIGRQLLCCSTSSWLPSLTRLARTVDLQI